MWGYRIIDGALISPDKLTVEGHGYSGQPQYRNDPTAVAIHGEGPIPPNVYRMSLFFDDVDHIHAKGKLVCTLTPQDVGSMFGRSGFMVHGDNINAPGTASDGCIILGRSLRLALSLSDDRMIEVVSGDETKRA